MGFFDKKQGAAEFKHAVLERYVPIFASKVGAYSTGNRVHLLDGYAGRGWYDDDSPGSPALLLGTAKALATNRNVNCWFVEEDASNFHLLSSRLEESALTARVHVLQGTMVERLAEITAPIGTDPLFALVDPFGIGLPFDCLVGNLLGRTGKTEVLVSFIHAGVYRNAGRLTQQTDNVIQQKVAEKVLPQLDANLGGSWWRDIWLAQASMGAPVNEIRDRYVEKVKQAAGSGWRCYRLPVSDRPDGATIYDMLLFTRNPEGSWCFNDAVSNAREFVEGQGLARRGSAHQPALWDPADDWVTEIERNLEALLPPGGRPVRLAECIDDVYGRSLGFARSKHVRQAAERLHKRGVIMNDIKGIAPEKLRVVPRARPTQTA